MKTNLKSKVENFCGVRNQFIITTSEGRFFQSYESIIAFIPKKGKTKLDESYWNYSKTTSRYRSRFLNENTEETRKKLLRGDYKLTNLN
jgi:hypothetical protein